MSVELFTHLSRQWKRAPRPGQGTRLLGVICASASSAAEQKPNGRGGSAGSDPVARLGTVPENPLSTVGYGGVEKSTRSAEQGARDDRLPRTAVAQVPGKVVLKRQTHCPDPGEREPAPQWVDLCICARGSASP
jgi:hypothetical protein